MTIFTSFVRFEFVLDCGYQIHTYVFLVSIISLWLCLTWCDLIGWCRAQDQAAEGIDAFDYS